MLNFKVFLSNRTVFAKLLICLSGTLLWGCGTGSALVDWGLVTPVPTPDPYAQYRAILQPHAADDIETAGALPQVHVTAQLNQSGDALTGTMTVTLQKLLPEIVFRLYPNLDNYNGSIKITEARINNIPTTFDLLADDSALQLTVPSNIAAGPMDIELTFTTQVGTASFNEDYALFGWQDSILSLPGFFPMLAVHQNGAWVLTQPPQHGDVLFNEVALYQLDITLPSDLTVAAGGVPLDVIDNPDRTRTWQLFGGPLRDMTVIAGPFQAISDSAAGATVTAYYLPGNEAAAQIVLAHTTASLRLYSDTFGPYPYTKLDVVEAPLGYRGMEYAGLILIGSNLYQDQRQFLTFLVAHEVAHQWWYALVGNNPYRHPWLDEGLTEYSAFYYYRGIFGQSHAEELLTGRWQIPFAAAAAGGIDGAVDRPAADFDPATYELLVYGKAALFFNALRETLGEEMYRQVLQTYYTENKYGIVTPQTLLATAQRVSGKNLSPLADDWLK